MKVMQILALATSSVLAAAAGAADSPSAPRSIAIDTVVRAQASFVIMQVEYCLRNAPDLRTELTLAHSTYAQASEHAAQILRLRYPMATTTRLRFAAESDPKARAFQLRQIQSGGPQQCDALVSQLNRSTGESLARSIGRSYESLLDRARRDQ